MASEKNDKIEKAIEIIKEMSIDPKEWELYRSRQMAIMNYNIGMSNSEKKAKKEIARKLLDKGLKIEEIIEITELTKEEIEELKK